MDLEGELSRGRVIEEELTAEAVVEVATEDKKFDRESLIQQYQVYFPLSNYFTMQPDSIYFTHLSKQVVNTLL